VAETPTPPQQRPTDPRWSFPRTTWLLKIFRLAAEADALDGLD